MWRSFRALVLNHASDLGRRSTSCHSAPGFHLMLLRSVCFRDSNTSIDDGYTIRMALSFLESSLLTEYTFLPIDVLIFALKEQEHESASAERNHEVMKRRAGSGVPKPVQSSEGAPHRLISKEHNKGLPDSQISIRSSCRSGCA